MAWFWEIYETYRLGDLLNVVGFLITIFGFVVTIGVALLSKRAAEKAKEAAEDARARIAHVDIISDITAAIATLDEIKTLHREKRQWVLLPDRYSKVRRALISSASSNTMALTEEDRAVIVGAQQQVNTMEKRLEPAINGGANDLDVARLNQIVTQEADRLHTVIAGLRMRLTE